MRSEAEKKAQLRYEKSGVIVRKTVKFHRFLDSDILLILDSVENFNGFVKALIREKFTHLMVENAPPTPPVRGFGGACSIRSVGHSSPVHAGVDRAVQAQETNSK